MNRINELHITPGAFEAMLAHFRSELPREGCGFLAGRGRVASRFYPIHNLSPELRRFSMDPRHVQRTEISIFRRNQRLLGVCHSHPEGECYPSRWDIAGAFFDPLLRWPLWLDEVQVIALMDPLEAPIVKGFRIVPGGYVEEVPVETAASHYGNLPDPVIT
jgi:proteasome lid subunit RPN8/RPN11